MFTRLARRRPSASLLVSLLALFVALGGTTYAVTVPRNSIGAAQLRSASVTTSKLAAKSVIRTKLGGGVVGTDQIGTQVVTAAKIAAGGVGNGQLASNAVSGSKLASSSVSNSKLGSGSVSNAKLGTNSVSTSKIQGGAVGASKLEKIVVREASVTVPANVAGNGEYFTRLVQANCASNERAIGLGTRWTVDNNDEELITVSLRFATDAAGNPNGAIARAGSDLAVDRVFAVQVSCLQE